MLDMMPTNKPTWEVLIAGTRSVEKATAIVEGAGDLNAGRRRAQVELTVAQRPAGGEWGIRGVAQLRGLSPLTVSEWRSTKADVLALANVIVAGLAAEIERISQPEPRPGCPGNVPASKVSRVYYTAA